MLYLLIFLSGLWSTTTEHTKNSPEKVCLSNLEQDLYDMIMNYREAEGLEKVPISESLTMVAQLHARDLQQYYEQNEKCNPHSWSKNGNWTSCCYTNDHKQSKCMWDKPMEIAGYDSPGYEIAYWHSLAAVPDEALIGWKKSKAHNPVIVNENQWNQVKWKAIGVGIYEQYAVVWFGEMTDHRENLPTVCE
jgi:uncharacterized protein YkwD